MKRILFFLLFISSIVNGQTNLNFVHKPVDAAQNLSLPAHTYSSGVITASANGAIGLIDSVTMALGSRVLLWRDSLQLQNGIYILTQVGDGSHPFKFTRDPIASIPINLASGSSVFVRGGYWFQGKTFTQTTTGTITVGTTALAYLPVQTPATNNNLTQLNTVSSGTRGGITGALFTSAAAGAGKGNALWIPSNPSLQIGATDFTIAGWCYHDSLSTHPQVIANVDDDSSQAGSVWYMGYYPIYGSYVFQVETGTNNTRYIISSIGTPTTFQWHFVVGWYDHVNGSVHIQVDNGPIDSLTGVAAVSHLANTCFAIGSVGGPTKTVYPDSCCSTFNGVISSVGFWKRVLTPTERTALYGTTSLVNTANFGTFNGTWSADVPASLSSLVNSSVYNGSTGVTSLTSSVGLSPIGSAASVWFKETAGTFTGVLMSNSGNAFTYIRLLDATHIRVQTDANATFKDFTVPTISINTWYNLIVNRDGSSNTHVYINGTESSSGGQAQTVNLITITQMGRYWDNSVPSLDFTGKLSNAMLFKSTLTGTDISNIAAGSAPVTTPYVWYKLNEGSGSFINDYGQYLSGTPAGAFTSLPYRMQNESRQTFVSYWPLTESSGTRHDRELAAIAGTTTSITSTDQQILFNNSTALVGNDALKYDVTNKQFKLTPGTLVDGKQSFTLTGTMPVSASASNQLANFDGTFVASGQNQEGLQINMHTGATGATQTTAAAHISNENAGTGTGVLYGSPSDVAIEASSYLLSSTTSGYKVGVSSAAQAGLINSAYLGYATSDRNSGTNNGASFMAYNGGSSPGLNGLYVGIRKGRPTTYINSVLELEDSSNSVPLIYGTINGTKAFQVDHNGSINLGNFTPSIYQFHGEANNTDGGVSQLLPGFLLKNTSTATPVGSTYNYAPVTVQANNGGVSGNITASFGVAAAAPYSDGTGIYVGSATAHPLKFFTNAAIQGAISSAGNWSIGSTTDATNGKLQVTGNLTLEAAGNRLFITEGSGSPVGQTTLISGTKAITISGLTTSSRAFVTLVSQGGTVTTTINYAAVCTSNTLTITALTSGGATDATDTSVINYFVIN